ncbi:MAG: serine hydroxymethyltransferase [Rickettsiaceae bacterium]|nr:MAG: serine hydroxymethyltransferase [Rickettsiaceae bacterium]
MNFLKDSDDDIFNIINQEQKRQESSIELIASENFASRAVMEAQGSCLTNKYAEGYPGKRYYSGCFEVDLAENMAISRAKQLFNCEYVNVQPHSGSQANQAVFLALLKPGDTILGMSMDSGGHLTHGALPNLSGKWFKSVTYNVDKESYLINYDQIRELAHYHKPKLIIAGYSCYPRSLDFKKFREIADEVGAFLLADIAHIAGLVAAGEHISPLPHAHVVTSTTHKTLRGPRGGIIMSNDIELGRKFDSALFPGIQGGPLMHVIAAKAVAFGEALQAEYKQYIKQVMINAKVLSSILHKLGFNILTGGTDNHLVVINLSDFGISGKLAADSLEKAGITCNKNSIPFDATSPFVTSGIRLGTPACTTRGFEEYQFFKVAELISILLNGLKNNLQDNSVIEAEVKIKVQNLVKQFPIY